MSLLSRSCFALVPALALAALVLNAPAAHAQAQVTFSGGSGTPLSFTIGSPITYTITGTAPGDSPFFVFDGVGGSPFGFSPVSGNVTFTVNGGAVQTLNYLVNGYSGNDVTGDDLYTYGSLPGLAVGDVVTLSAGTLTTTGNFGAAAPNSGSYTTFITAGFGNRISTFGTSAAVTPVPEPGEWAIMGMLGTSVCGLMVRARRKASTSRTLAHG